MFDDALYYVTLNFQGKMFPVIVKYMTLEMFAKECHVRFHELPRIVSTITIDEDEFDEIEALIENKSQIFEGDGK